MKTIYLVRHAKSSWEFTELPDQNRPLLEIGKKRTKKIIDFLVEKKTNPDLIISSSALRCKETAGYIARGLSYPVNEIQINPEIYHASLISLFNLFYDLSNQYQSVMVVGHDPALTNFVNNFTKIPIDYIPTSGVVCIEFETDNWDTIHNSEYTIKYMMYPKLLSRAKTT